MLAVLLLGLAAVAALYAVVAWRDRRTELLERDFAPELVARLMGGDR